MQENGIDTETLYLGLTRPAVSKIGLPYNYLVVVVMVSMVFAINISYFFAAGILFIGYVFGLWVFKDDYNLLNIILLKMKYQIRNKNHKFWQSKSYDPS